jgi:HK97 family phage major capsid protein
MEKKIKQTLATMRELESKLQTATAEEREDLLKQYAALEREANRLQIELAMANNNREEKPVDVNTQMREAIKQVRSHQADGDFLMKREATPIITSGIIQGGEKTNMASAGIPLTIKDLINPLGMGTIYEKLGLQVATGVRGNIQWPCLDTSAEVSVGGELDEAETKTLDFSKITATPVKVGISIEVSNEAINDESFDLVGVIKEQMNKAVGRTLNKRVLALSAPSAKPAFVGPLVSNKQTATYTKAGATYKDVKALKAKVLKTGAQMAGFCYVMDAEMYSTLECTPKDNGSGLFIIEGGKIDGDVVFITDLAEYAGKIVAGCFAYEALNQHGEVHFIVDPYTKAKKNVTVFTLNADFSLTYLVSANNTKGAPFVVASAAAQ